MKNYISRETLEKEGSRWITTLFIWILIFIIMVLIGYMIDIPGSDWINYWVPRNIGSYPPWLGLLLDFIPTLPYLTGLTLTFLLFAMWRRKATFWQYLAAFTSMPLYGCIWLGQLDAFPMFGLSILPWGIPLVLLKPQVAFFYTWVWWRKRSDRWQIAIGVIIFLAMTFAFWGNWLQRFTRPDSLGTVYDLSIWRLHWILGLIIFVLAMFESDPDRAMALGALGAPYIQGASYLVLIPALTRFSGWRLLLLWLTTWGSIIALVFGDVVRPMAILFPITLWAMLFFQERSMRYVEND